AARVLGFASVAEALGEAERAVAAADPPAACADFVEIARILSEIPSLASGAPASLNPGPVVEGGPLQIVGRRWPLSLLLVGGPELERRLVNAVERERVEFQRLETSDEAAQVARVLGPDLVLL